MEWLQIQDHSALFRNLLRLPTSPPPSPTSVADLTPWSCTWAEFHQAPLGPTEHVDGFGDIGTVASLKATDPETGRDRIYWAHFDWCILQSVEPAPDAYVWGQ